MGKKILHLKPSLLSEKCRKFMLVWGQIMFLFAPSGVLDAANTCSRTALRVLAAAGTAAVAGASTGSDLWCLQASGLLRRLVGKQTCGKGKLGSELCVSVLYWWTLALPIWPSAQSPQRCSLQQTRLLPGCISKVCNALADKLSYFRWINGTRED